MDYRALESTAYHEAGHAVIALCYGRFVESIKIDAVTHDGWTQASPPPPIGDIKVEKGSLRKHFVRLVKDTQVEIAIALGGPLAEGKYLDKNYLHLPSCVDDHKRVEKSVRELAFLRDHIKEFKGLKTYFPTDWFEMVAKETEDLLMSPDNWRAIRTIAESLLRNNSINSRELLYLLGATYTPSTQLRLYDTISTH